MMMALHIWSLSHGIASLFARGDAARRTHADDAGGAAGSRHPHLPRRLGHAGEMKSSSQANDVHQSVIAANEFRPLAGSWLHTLVR